MMPAAEPIDDIPMTRLSPGSEAAAALEAAAVGAAKRRRCPEIPGYEILGELGRGGMGIVYWARQLALKRSVALKMIVVGADEGVRLRFRVEAEAVARLQHPNIVQIHEIGEHEGQPYLCLEYVAGGSLHEKISRTGLPDREAAQLVETLARAIHYTHQQGILHRDLKPTNILLAADGTPKITDFGLAKLLDQNAGLTRTEALLGTPNYMPPEQAGGDTRKIGAASDVYSLGAVLYELLTGRAPFRGTTLYNTLEQVRTQLPVAPRRLRRPIARDLDTICLKCLEKEPAHRYASAAALADDLRNYLDGNSIRARPAPFWQRGWRFMRRRPAVAACLLAVAAVTCLGLGAGTYFRVTDDLKGHVAEEQYQHFVQHRDDAFFYGLLMPDQGAAFLGTEAAANARKAEAAAQEALTLAGINLDGDDPIPSRLPPIRKAEADTDCYALLLVLASLRQQQIPPGESSGKAGQRALRTLEVAHRLGLETRAYYVRRTDVLERLGNVAEAAKNSERASAVAVTGTLDYFLLGEDQYRHGEWAEAKASFGRALRLQPGHFWARFFLAVCHLKAKEWSVAKARLDACLEQQPNFVWTYLFRSFANERLHALADARADFHKAFQLNPNEDARYVLLLTRGILFFHQNDLEAAAADFRAAQALRPSQYNAYLNLAQVRLAQKTSRPPRTRCAGQRVSNRRRGLWWATMSSAASTCYVSRNTPRRLWPAPRRCVWNRTSRWPMGVAHVPSSDSGIGNRRSGLLTKAYVRAPKERIFSVGAARRGCGLASFQRRRRTIHVPWRLHRAMANFIYTGAGPITFPRPGSWRSAISLWLSSWMLRPPTPGSAVAWHVPCWGTTARP